MHWWLYLVLNGMLIAVPGHFDTLKDCRGAGNKAVADFKSIHKHAAAFAWCVQGGKDDLDCEASAELQTVKGCSP